MTTVVNPFQYLFPALVVAIALVFFCFYLHMKKTRGAFQVSIPTRQDNSIPPAIYTILCEDLAEEDRRHPRHSVMDPPPPYSLFDPKLTCAWPRDLPSASELYPITLPLAPHHWTTGTGRQHPTLIQHPSQPTEAIPGIHQLNSHFNC